MRELLFGRRPVDTMANQYTGEYDPSLTGDITLQNVALHYVLWEIATQDGSDNMPPSLHPTWPGLLSLLFWRVPDSPVGPFTFAAVGLASRTSIKPRQIVLSAFSDSPAARELLTPRYGYPVQIADVRQHEYSDAVMSSIDVGGQRIVDVTTRKMQDLSGTSAALKLSPQLSPAWVDGRLELLQNELAFQFRRTRRGTPRLHVVPTALGFLSDIPLSIPVAGSLAEVDITLHPARFALDCELPAESVKSHRLTPTAAV
jgi:hypothetical protein